LSPSQHTINTSPMPRLRSSVMTESQNFGDSPPVGPTHRPKMSRSPSMLMPMTTYTTRLVTVPSRILIRIPSTNSTG
jgi:hypothetical protein